MKERKVNTSPIILRYFNLLLILLIFIGCSSLTLNKNETRFLNFFDPIEVGEPPREVIGSMYEVGYDTVPMYKNQYGYFELEGRINGGPIIKLLLDYSLQKPIFNELHVRLLEIPLYETNDKLGLYGYNQKLMYCQIDSIRIGHGLINAMDARVTDFSENVFLGDLNVEGILGRDFLDKYNAIIDYGNSFLYLKK